MVTMLFLMAGLLMGQAPPWKGPPAIRPSPRPPATQPRSSYDMDYFAMVDQIRSSDAGEHEKVAALMAVWEKSDFGFPRAMNAACELATTPESIAYLLNTVEGHAKGANTEQMVGIRMFFGYRAGAVLCRKMQDPEPLLKLAVKHECWNSLLNYECPRELRDRYVLEGLKACRSVRVSPSVLSICHALSRERMPEIRQIARELGAQEKLTKGFEIAVGTLADWDDTEIIPDLERWMGKYQPGDIRRDMLGVYSAKLKYQHSPEDLKRLLATERENERLLEWATKRLLWLKTDLKTVERALESNRKPSKQGVDTAGRLLAKIRGDDEKGPGAHRHDPLPDFDPLILDWAERQALTTEMRQAEGVGPAGMVGPSRKLGMRALVSSAPSGD